MRRRSSEFSRSSERTLGDLHLDEQAHKRLSKGQPHEHVPSLLPAPLEPASLGTDQVQLRELCMLRSELFRSFEFGNLSPAGCLGRSFRLLLAKLVVILVPMPRKKHGQKLKHLLLLQSLLVGWISSFQRGASNVCAASATTTKRQKPPRLLDSTKTQKFARTQARCDKTWDRSIPGASPVGHRQHLRAADGLKEQHLGGQNSARVTL